MNKIIKSFKKKLTSHGKYTPLLIFILSAFARFYQLKQIYVFGGDEEYQVTYAATLVDNFHPIWIGVNAGHTGVYLGPLWTYFTAFWLFISGGSPLLTAFVAGTIGVLTTALIYYISKNLFNRKTAIVSSLLYALLPLVVYYDQKYWNPTLVPFISLVIFYSLYKTFTNPKWFVVFAVAYGMVFHVHLSLLPLGFIGIVVFLLNIRKMNKTIIILSIASFLLLYSPLLVFDYNHNWSNLRAPLKINRIVNFDESSKIDPLFHTKTLTDNLGRIWYLSPGTSSADEVLFACSNYASSTPLVGSSYSERTYAPLVSKMITLIALVAFVFNRNIKKGIKKYTIAYLSILILPFLYFPGGAFEYYLLGSFPILIIVFASSTRYKSYLFKVPYILLTTLILFMGVNTVVRNDESFGLDTKIKLVKDVSDYIGNNSYELFESGGCHAHEGWRYLFTVYGRSPSRSSAVDQKLGWLYPDKIYRGDLKYKVIMHENRYPSKETNDLIKEFSRGGFTAYLYNW